jgi:hypothetical protein
MEHSKPAGVEHLVVNRAEIVSEGCRACGQNFTWDPAGTRALSVELSPGGKTCVFCAACGDTIMSHLEAEAVRQRYGWDWVLPLYSAQANPNGHASLEATTARQGASPASNGASFHAFGRVYESERAAILSFLHKVRAGEANGGEAFAAWAAVCTTDSLRLGIRMIAERETYHARIFDQRLLELGGETHEVAPEEGRGFKEYLGNPTIPDREKLLRFARSVGDPQESIKPICEFAALIKEDVQTKEALLLFSEDELSSATWASKTSAALNQPTQAIDATASPSPAHSD